MPAAVIVDHDPSWSDTGQQWLRRIRAAIERAELPEGDAFRYDHIGSTSVPGLAAKAIIDLQMTAPRLPDRDGLADVLAPLGLEPAQGSRPDSPGVHADIPRPGVDASPALYRKQLFSRPGSDTELPVILHIRRADSPFAQWVVDFRDWLRAHPDDAREYERIKRAIAAAHENDADYDDYTRAKTEHLDAVQARVDAWAAGRGS